MCQQGWFLLEGLRGNLRPSAGFFWWLLTTLNVPHGLRHITQIHLHMASSLVYVFTWPSLQGHQSLDIRLTFIQCDLILTNYVSKTLSPDEVTF